MLPRLKLQVQQLQATNHDFQKINFHIFLPLKNYCFLFSKAKLRQENVVGKRVDSEWTPKNIKWTPTPKSGHQITKSGHQ